MLIVAFPSAFWLILETSTINSRKLPFYGPKKVIKAGDTSYYRTGDSFLAAGDSTGQVYKSLDPEQFPIYAIIFLNKKYRSDSYRLTGLWEYLNYKQSKVEHIPFVLMTPYTGTINPIQTELAKLAESKNVHFRSWPGSSYDSLTYSFFKEKPYYIDYSFFLLIDRNRHIRGYYDGRYVSELKRLIDEYQHLRLKEEKQKLIDGNEIHTKDSL